MEWQHAFSISCQSTLSTMASSSTATTKFWLDNLGILEWTACSTPPARQACQAIFRRLDELLSWRRILKEIYSTLKEIYSILIASNTESLVEKMHEHAEGMNDGLLIVPHESRLT